MLAALWSADHALTPSEVRDQVGADLAYTTVSTILVRLADKGMVSRKRAGKVYQYRAVLDEAGMTAERMHTELLRAGNTNAALSRFVGTLTPAEARAVRSLLEEG